MIDGLAIEMTKEPSQDVVLVVSLVRTLTNSYGSAVDLYRKLKRVPTHKSLHENEDAKNDTKRHHTIPRRDSAADHTWNHHHHVTFNLDSTNDGYVDRDEEDIDTSSFRIQTEYDYGYRELGEKFARGELNTQVQLQSQIIQLEQTLLRIYEDLMLSTYMLPSHTHLARLVQTTRSTRTAAIQALRMQYQHMQSPVKPNKPEVHRPIPGAFPTPTQGPLPHKPPSHGKPKRKARSRSSESSDSTHTLIPRPKPKTSPHINKLFCVYANDLQRDPQIPLADNYKAGSDNQCPSCHTNISIRPGKAWEVIVEDGRKHCKSGRTEFRKFLVHNRFVVKCHREWGGFACVLCSRFKETDTVCRSIGALVEHLWTEHTGEEMAKDGDIVRVD